MNDDFAVAGFRRSVSLTIAIVLCILIVGNYAHADSAWPTGATLSVNQPPPITDSAVDTISAMQAQLDDQAAQLELLRDQLGQYADAFGDATITTERDCGCPTTKNVRRFPLVGEEEIVPGCGLSGDGSEAGGTKFKTLDFYPTYDRGFVIRSMNPKKLQYELIIPGWIQFRHHGFTRDVESWTDNAGVTRPVRNRNAFDIERARLYFVGWAHDKRLRFFFHLDADTDGRHAVDFFDYWWAWDFTDRFRVQFGKRKVPASRQWLLGARRTRLIDRPVATDFFRPDRTVGVYAIGKTGESGHYEMMVGNGYRTANLPNSQTDDRFTFAATQYFEPLGKFGSQLADYDCSSSPLLQFGHSFVFSPQTADSLGAPLPETDFIRLTDGTRLNQTGALAPGVTVSEFDLYYYSVDLAAKYRGWSFNAEVYFRWLEQMAADGPLPTNDLFQRGFFVEGGRFLIPKKLDINGRYSQVHGIHGSSDEWAGGLNWYPLDSHKLKISFDVTVLDGTPLQNTATDILAGDDGVLFRTQFQAEF